MNGIIELRPAEALSLLPRGFLGQIYLWGIEVIKVIQRVESPALTTLVKLFTNLGSTYFYVPVILIIFLLVDEKRGLRLGIFIIVSAWINSFLKDLWALPRPYELDASLGLAFEPTYGAPSGHAQMSLCFWVPMGLWLQERVKRRGLLWTGIICFLLLIGFSRLYLGVHFPSDLFAGWIIALLLVAGIWFFPGPAVERITGRMGTRFFNIAAAGLALIMNILYPGDTSLSGLFLGFCLGYNLMKARFPYSAREDLKGKKPDLRIMIFRLVIGFVGLGAVYMVFRLLFPGEGSIFSYNPLWGESSPYHELGRFVRYALVGFWASAGAPLLFQRIGLAVDPESSQETNG